MLLILASTFKFKSSGALDAVQEVVVLLGFNETPFFVECWGVLPFAPAPMGDAALVDGTGNMAQCSNFELRSCM